MSKGIMNRRDKMIWDNSALPTIDDVTGQISDLAESVAEDIEEAYNDLDDKIEQAVTDCTYTAGTNIEIDEDNVISSTLTAGTGIEISGGQIALNEENASYLGSVGYSYTAVKTGTKFVDGNDIWKITVACGTLPNATTATVAHAISGISKAIFWEAVGVSTSLFIDIANRVTIDGTNINIDAGSDDLSGYTGYVTIYYTLKKSFDKVLFTTDYSDTSDSSQYQLYGTNGYNNRVWLPNATNKVYIGLYNNEYGLRALAMTKEASVTVKNRYRRLGGGSQQGISDLALSNAYSDKGYYGDVSPSGGNYSFNGNRMGIEVVYANASALLSAFFD